MKMTAPSGMESIYERVNPKLKTQGSFHMTRKLAKWLGKGSKKRAGGELGRW